MKLHFILKIYLICKRMLKQVTFIVASTAKLVSLNITFISIFLYSLIENCREIKIT